jgi:hypothetical protein
MSRSWSARAEAAPIVKMLVSSPGTLPMKVSLLQQGNMGQIGFLVFTLQETKKPNLTP